MSKPLWSGRFDSAPDPAAFDFGVSFPFDRRLFEDDVTGSLAWAQALERAGVAAIDLSGGAFSDYRIEADSRTPGFAAPPRLQLLYEPATLIVMFDGDAPYTLAAGAAGAFSVCCIVQRQAAAAVRKPCASFAGAGSRSPPAGTRLGAQARRRTPARC